MEPLEFTTHHKTPQPAHTITADLLGDHYTLDRPKDWILQQAALVTDDTTLDTQQRAVAMIQFLNPVLGNDGMERFLQRAVDNDDPLDLAATRDFIAALKHRWDNWDTTPNTPIVITTEEPPTYRRPVPFRLDETDYTCHPPKNLVIGILDACRQAPELGKNWAMEIFLTATMTTPEATHLRDRLNQPPTADTLDLADLDPIISAVLDRWNTDDAPMNRAERRALQHR